MDETQSPLTWDQGAPRSALYGDIYFSLEDGLAETRAVFLEGCGLPDAWAGQGRFTVAELGFGSGLNICALLDLWRKTRAPPAQLHVFSIEAHPISRQDAARALSAFPEIAQVAQALLAQWPGQRRGFHRLEFPDLRAIVDVAVMEAGEALGAWSGAADAWFLDGFSPALNPAMWRGEVLELIAKRSAPGARLATFTVAGEVRRGLQAAGFEVEKKPGFGRKRQRLEGRFPGARHNPATARPAMAREVIVIGDGIAGAALARAFAGVGRTIRVIADPAIPAASGNPAALVTPALDAGGGVRAALYANAFSRAVRLYDGLDGAVISRGAIQVEVGERDADRFDRIVNQDLFEPGILRRLAPEAVAAMLDEPQGLGGLMISDGLVVDPATIRQAWLPAVTPGRVESLRSETGGYRLMLADGREAHCSILVVASGLDAARLLPGLDLKPVRGQASFADGVDPGTASAFGGYAIPTKTGVLFGATHDRGETDLSVRGNDHARNLELLARGRPNLAARLAQAALAGRAGLRAVTPDRLPIAGEIEPGLYVLTGLGSRGFTTAPLLAEHIAALAEGLPSPLQAELCALVSPRSPEP